MTRRHQQRLRTEHQDLGEDMATARPLPSAHRPWAHEARLLRVIAELQRLEADLIGDGFDTEAGSVATTRTDLEWQREELAVSTQVSYSS